MHFWDTNLTRCYSTALDLSYFEDSTVTLGSPLSGSHLVPVRLQHQGPTNEILLEV